MTDAPLPPAIFLMGPTASGKSALALLLCEQLPCEIVSVDSTAVYRGLDIGSAKPNAGTLARVPHHLIDIREPQSPYSVAEFRNDALAAMQEIAARGKVPLLVGGSMLYFKALLGGLAELPAADPAIRAKIEAEAAARGWPALHAELAQIDAVAAARIHPTDTQRLQRALEVYRSCGVTLTALQYRHRSTKNVHLPYRVTQLAIAPRDRGLLHQRIDERFRMMLNSGLVEEVKLLLEHAELHTDLPALKAVGYRQVVRYLNNEYDEAQLVERGVIATRQLAKRQLTWLRSWKNLNWLYFNQSDFINGFDREDNMAERQSILRQALNFVDPGAN
ncbi:MAG: tRNA (adenosine(37)-N6)-dimethylallyltransferase MiaA [Pseudomonadales bacterium]